MIEISAKALESALSKENTDKISLETRPRELPKEISRAPEPNFKPPWEDKPRPSVEIPRSPGSKPLWENKHEPSVLRPEPSGPIRPPWESGPMLPHEPSEPFQAVGKIDSMQNIENGLTSRNKDLEGKKHPETGVPFEKKTVEDKDGNETEGVFPVFESLLDVQMPENLYEASDKDQFAECNKELKEAVEKDPEFAKKFTPEQLEQIKNGETPDGYTWHHNEECGKMQLVDSEIHAKTGHTGGKVIWGGGQENR
jgi:hypothetical protein